MGLGVTVPGATGAGGAIGEGTPGTTGFGATAGGGTGDSPGPGTMIPRGSVRTGGTSGGSVIRRGAPAGGTAAGAAPAPLIGEYPLPDPSSTPGGSVIRRGAAGAAPAGGAAGGRAVCAVAEAATTNARQIYFFISVELAGAVP